MAIVKPSKPNTFINGAGNTADATEVNEDFDILYAKEGEIIDAINNAAGSKATLDARLDVSLNEDGTLKTAATSGGEWIDPDLSPAYASTTTFTVAGDHEDIYLANRRLKVALVASTVYTEVVSSNHSGGTTTVTVLNAVLTDPLTSVEHSIIRPLASDGAVSPEMVGALPSGQYTAADVLTKMLTVDGSGSGLDADLLDGFHASQTPGPDQIPVFGATGWLTLPGRLTTAGSSGVMANASPNDFAIQVMDAGGAADSAHIALHRGGKYAVLFGLDTDNKLKVGGWSMGNVAHQIRHDGNTFHGRVAANGTAIRLPPGWSSLNTSTGVFNITHNLGHTNYTVLLTVNEVATANPPASAWTFQRNANDIVLYTATGAGLANLSFGLSVSLD